MQIKKNFSLKKNEPEDIKIEPVSSVVYTYFYYSIKSYNLAILLHIFLYDFNINCFSKEFLLLEETSIAYCEQGDQ